MSNPRFPHRVVIERVSGGSSFEQPTRTVIYDGECRNYRNQVVKDTKGVLVSDYIITEGLGKGFLRYELRKEHLVEHC